jgi:hypothetical protein
LMVWMGMVTGLLMGSERESEDGLIPGWAAGS